MLQEEKTHRSEMTNSKMHYDNKIALLQEEAQSTQMHLEKTRRERDILRYFNMQFFTSGILAFKIKILSFTITLFHSTNYKLFFVSHTIQIQLYILSHIIPTTECIF